MFPAYSVKARNSSFKTRDSIEHNTRILASASLTFDGKFRPNLHLFNTIRYDTIEEFKQFLIFTCRQETRHTLQ